MTTSKVGRTLLALTEAQAIIAAACRPKFERRSLGAAAGFVLSQSVTARTTRPSRPLAAMDGYAVPDDRPCVGGRWRCVGRAYPGAPFARALSPGEAVRVTTGAAAPQGSARILLDEDVEARGEEIALRASSELKTHIRLIGSDFAAGDVLVASGSRLTPGALIAAAAAETQTVEVFSRPALSLLTIGDELCLGPEDQDGVPDTLTAGLTALALAWGSGPVRTAQTADAPQDLRRALKALQRRASVLVTAGAASGSDRDAVRSVAAELGARPLFAGLALKPGKPSWAALLGETLVIGLPGNPAAALVAARLLLAPALQILSAGSAAAAEWRWGRLAQPLGAGGAREEALRARATSQGLEVFDRQDSASQAALATVTALVRREAGASAKEAGDPVAYASLEPSCL